MTVPSGFRTLKAHYRSGKDTLATDFFAPCLADASLYRRAAGYFSSGALLTWVSALPRALRERSLTIRLIASPHLGADDLAVLEELSDGPRRVAYRQMVADRVLEQIAALIQAPGDARVRALLFAWMLASDRLVIRFAFAAHLDGGSGVFHEKMGIFDFADGSRVAFTGSANETLGGHRRNYESIDVYRSWHSGEEDRVATKAAQFEEAWCGEATGLDVVEPSPALLARIRAMAPRDALDAPSPPVWEDRRWRHQAEAHAAFVQAKAGVLEMATGTGKTRTTLRILESLIGDGAIEAAIVATDGTDLLDQWSGELDAWNLASARDWLVHRHFASHRELGAFALDPSKGILVISREQLHKVLPRLPAVLRSRMAIVHDEVHGLGVPSLIGRLAGEHAGFGWRLGLSATPDRAYDQDGNDFLDREIGPTIFEFPLEAAIERGVLAPFDYVPLAYDLTPNDRKRLKDVYAKQSARQRDGNPMAKEEVWTELSKVYKTAEMKPDVFREFIATDPTALRQTIVFVETREYGNALLEAIHGYTSRYRTYYADDDRDHLVQFARGDIDCLITCHRISQGIDIRALRNVVLFASARARLETIQRIGRCLRADPGDPGKRARVIDFVRPPNPADPFPNADQDRAAWLRELSAVRRVSDA